MLKKPFIIITCLLSIFFLCNTEIFAQDQPSYLFLETFNTEPEQILFEKNYTWDRGMEPETTSTAKQFYPACDNFAYGSASLFTRTSRDELWHLEGYFTAISKLAIQGGKLYSKQYINDNGKGAYWHGIFNSALAEQSLNIIGGGGKINHLTRLSVDFNLIGAHTDIIYTPPALKLYLTLYKDFRLRQYLIGYWTTKINLDGLFPYTEKYPSFEGYNINIKDMIAPQMSNEEFDTSFADATPAGIGLEIPEFIFRQGWDCFGDGNEMYLEFTVDNIKVYGPVEHRLIISQAKTDKPSYTTGEEAKISCRLTDDEGATIVSVLVTAEITKPDNSTETVLLSEKPQEQGAYEDVFTNISLQGTYNATIKAEKQGYTDATSINLTFTAERNKIPLGKSLSITNPDIEFYSIYIPDRYGGDFTITASGGGAIELYYPDPYTKVANAAAQINYAVAFNQHDWYYVKVVDRGSISHISNTFVQIGEASYRPWNFWYWPFKRQDNPAKNLYGEGGDLEKYDAVFNTEAREYEEKNYSEGCPWCGHCLGGSIASILVSQPQAVTYSGVWFNQEEIEGLVAKLANTENVLGEDLVINVPSLKPQPGVDETDKFADDFHIGLVNYIRKPKQRNPLQSNLRDPQGIDPSAVWNHAIYKYISTMEEAEEGREDIIKITTTIYANADIFPSDDNTIDRIETYVYKLRYKLNGEIDEKFIGEGQDWISSTGFAPGNLSYITECLFNNTFKNNPYVKKENVEKLGVDFPESP